MCVCFFSLVFGTNCELYAILTATPAFNKNEILEKLPRTFDARIYTIRISRSDESSFNYQMICCNYVINI